MKSEMKRSAALISALILTFSIYSCDSEPDNIKSSSETGEVTTTAASTVPEETTDINEVDVDSLKYDYSGLKTEKYINILRSGRYKCVMRSDASASSDDLYFDYNQKKSLQKYNDPEISDNIVYTSDGKDYIISLSRNKYYVLNNESQVFAPNCLNLYTGYLESGEKQIDGTTYFYDEYYNVDVKNSIKILVDKEGKLYGIDNNQQAAIMFDELTGEFDDSVFDVLDGCTQITQEEYMSLLKGNTTPEE